MNKNIIPTLVQQDNRYFTIFQFLSVISLFRDNLFRSASKLSLYCLFQNCITVTRGASIRHSQCGRTVASYPGQMPEFFEAAHWSNHQQIPLTVLSVKKKCFKSQNFQGFMNERKITDLWFWGSILYQCLLFAQI